MTLNEGCRMETAPPHPSFFSSTTSIIHSMWRLPMATSQQARAGNATATSNVTRRPFSLLPYLFILPHLIFFAAFLAYPFFYGIDISLFNFDFLRPEFRPFVGLENYANLLINRN